MKVLCLTTVDSYKKGKIYEATEGRRLRVLIKLGYLVLYEETKEKLIKPKYRRKKDGSTSNNLRN